MLLWFVVAMIFYWPKCSKAEKSKNKTRNFVEKTKWDKINNNTEVCRIENDYVDDDDDDDEIMELSYCNVLYICYMELICNMNLCANHWTF